MILSLYGERIAYPKAVTHELSGFVRQRPMSITNYQARKVTHCHVNVIGRLPSLTGSAPGCVKTRVSVSGAAAPCKPRFSLTRESKLKRAHAPNNAAFSP